MKEILVTLVVLTGLKSSFGVKMGGAEIDYNHWWGPKYLKHTNNTSIRPFRIEFGMEMIEDLRYRLKTHRPFVPPLEGVGFSYGFNSDYIHGWLKYWADCYPFMEREHFLNQYPQYKTNIQGLDIHFLRVTPKNVPRGVEVVPLLLLHGWPGSVREFYETLPLLTSVNRHRDFALEVIVPSLPGFGFSDAAVRPGLGANEIAVVFRNLMHRLGYKHFYVQGGDWGAVICSAMATLFPKEILGHHTNLAVSFSTQTFATWLIGSMNPASVVDPALQDRMYPVMKIFNFFLREFGYFHLQAMKPDTIGIALSDTPAGLLAYILQLFSTGTRAAYTFSEDGGLDNHYRREQLIDNLMIYWATNTITTSCRIYAETANMRTLASGITEIPSPVPTWTIHAKDEIVYQSPALLKFKYPNLINSTVLNTGGHFLALELPEVFAEDVLTAIATFRSLNKY